MQDPVRDLICWAGITGQFLIVNYMIGRELLWKFSDFSVCKQPGSSWDERTVRNKTIDDHSKRLVANFSSYLFLLIHNKQTPHPSLTSQLPNPIRFRKTALSEEDGFLCTCHPSLTTSIAGFLRCRDNTQPATMSKTYSTKIFFNYLFDTMSNRQYKKERRRNILQRRTLHRHHAKWTLANGLRQLVKVPTQANVADMLIKPKLLSSSITLTQ